MIARACAGLHPTLRRFAWAIMWLHVCTGMARAQQAAESYETRRLELFLTDAKLAVDPAPEGKLIAYVRVERREVFEPNDLAVPIILPSFASTWPNMFHWVTTEQRVRRELLLHEGDVYSERLAEETMRNLRRLSSILAMARIVAVKTTDPTRVGLVVYTRDIWSLRFEQTFAGAGGTFAANAQLVERNLFGSGQALTVRSSIDPRRFSVGQMFEDYRFLGHELSVSERFDVIFNRHTTNVEGSTGRLLLERPFYNLSQRSAFRLFAYYANYVFRDTRAGEVVGFSVDPARQGKQCELGASACLARVWRERLLQLELSADYRTGTAYKATFSGGFAVSSRRVGEIAETGLTPEQVPLFHDLVLPKVRRDIYPFVRYRLSVPRFAVFTNLGTYGLSENIQVGPQLEGLIAVPLKAYGASSDGLILRGTFSYVWSEHDALLDMAAEGRARLESGSVVDQRGVVRVRGASPQIEPLFGRFVFSAYWDVRSHDTQRTFVSLGGDNGLRGYAAQRFYAFGARRILGNFEYRSQPVLLQSVHLGLVAFYDVGSVYQRLSAARFHHDVGAGLRVLFPQLNRTVFRFDVGVPLDSPGFSVQMTYGSDPILPLTAAEDLASSADDAARPSL
ncbi:MAG TPA: BamA/TamA family outer membrane protein [Polyangiales bacterium]|nr:BamA/TamA family outer membrane protein [Polyangiales bacterium]